MKKQIKKFTLEKTLSNNIDNLSTSNIYPELLELDETQEIKDVNSWTTKDLDEENLYDNFEQEYHIKNNPYNHCFPI